MVRKSVMVVASISSGQTGGHKEVSSLTSRAQGTSQNALRLFILIGIQ